MHEDSNVMSDEDFFDAHEDVDADGAKVNPETIGYAAKGSKSSMLESTRATEDKYIVKNKDTGEVFDIRELEQLSVDSYSMFPTKFSPTGDEESSVGNQESHQEKETKPRRPSMTKLKIKFPKKGKGKDTTRRNHVHVQASKKDKRMFEDLFLAQAIACHTGTIWTMKFSHDGARLASGGQDTVLRIWKVEISSGSTTQRSSGSGSGEKQILHAEPERCYQGHTMPIVDISWSRSNFVLSASMDKTVRLWHISREDCLHVFQHPDSVPAVDFHPKEDRYFLSGCFDNKARVWDIPDGCVVSYVQTPVMITAASFNPSGTRAIVGLLNGQCIFYQVNTHQQLNYYTQIECRNSRGPMKKGRKVTGVEFDPEGKYFLVSTNDSRMRLFSVDNYSRVCKYKGLVNDHLQIKGRFSQDGDHVICGSENGHVYIWSKSCSSSMGLMKSSKHDRNTSYEHFCAAEPPNGIVTVALFAPASTFAMVKHHEQAQDDAHNNACTGLIVTASYDGCIKFFERCSRLT